MIIFHNVFLIISFIYVIIIFNNFINLYIQVILLSTNSLEWYWLHRAFLIAKEAWFYGIDLSVSFDNFDTLDIEYINKISNEVWIKVLSISAPSKKINKYMVDKLLYMASYLWSQLVTFFPPHFSDKNIDWYNEYLPKLSKDSLISISIKNVEPEFLFFIIPARKNASLIEVKKVTWNTSFDISSSSDIIKDISFLGSSMKNIYLSDSLNDKKWLVLWTSVGNTSNLPIESFLMKLKANSYNWFFSIKLSPSELWVWDYNLVIDRLKGCISYYKKYFL